MGKRFRYTGFLAAAVLAAGSVALPIVCRAAVAADALSLKEVLERANALSLRDVGQLLDKLEGAPRQSPAPVASAATPNADVRPTEKDAESGSPAKVAVAPPATIPDVKARATAEKKVAAREPAPKATLSPRADPPPAVEAKPSAAPSPPPKITVAIPTLPPVVVPIEKKPEPPPDAVIEGEATPPPGAIRVATLNGNVWRKPGAGEAFRDCVGCPDMVAIPRGQFVLGAAARSSADPKDNTPGTDGSEAGVTIATAFAVGRYEVTRGEFSAFVQETKHRMESGCYRRTTVWEMDPDLSWSAPGYTQDDRHPVTCVSWNDAKAYVTWLSAKSGKLYRLLSEAEWEYAALGGGFAVPPPRFHFGNSERELCRYGNGADLAALGSHPGWTVIDCTDGHTYTAPAGKYEPNGYGLFDMHGNVWEFVEDCYHVSYSALPEGSRASGSAWTRGCLQGNPRVLRGGSWSDTPKFLRTGARIAIAPDVRDQIAGFRVARDLAP